MVAMLHSVITMGQANDAGFSRRRVYRLLQRGEWLQLHEGVYLSVSGLAGDARWKAELAGLMLRCGETALVSHGAAAILHRLEGVVGQPLGITVVSGSNRFPKPVHRSRFSDPNAVMIDGLATTSVARTLRDLAAECTVVIVEQAMESALRGTDRRRPDMWNKALLAELRSMVAEQPRLHGNHRLGKVLELRSDDDRPTGSFPETVLFQALRAVGLHAVRQATLRIVDANGVRLDTFYPDLALPLYRLLIEVDGGEAHADEGAMARDLRRQNKVLQGFRLLRFTAVEVLRDPDGVALQVKRSALRSTFAPAAAWTVDDVSVEYSTNRFLVVDRSRDARDEAMNRHRTAG